MTPIFDSLVTRVKQHAELRPDSTAFLFVRRHDDDGEKLTWKELWENSKKLASAIPISQALEHTGVLIFCDDEKNFITALLATWMRGAVVIPATGGLNAHLAERNRHIFECGKPDIVLHDLSSEKIKSFQSDNFQTTFVSLDHLPDSKGFDVVFDPTGPALIQFTSGSTSRPKAVFLDHVAISTNCASIQSTYRLSNDQTGVHWLPLYHDMGLVGSVLEVLWYGGRSVLLRPSIFIQRPSVWLKSISKWSGSITSAPNFAFERLLATLSPEDLEGLDLSCLNNVIFGGEPVSESTVKSLLDLLGPYGLSPDAIAPSYGLAEVTLLASVGRRIGGPRFSTQHSNVSIACLGSMVNGVNISIRNTDEKECAEGSIGEIWLDGPCTGTIIAQGENWRVPKSKVAIHTGDFGYMENGELYLTGRASNKIIIRGRNIFAEDVELLARQSQVAGFSSGMAALGIVENGTQSLYLLIEQARRNSVFDIDALNKNVAAILGVKLSKVVLLRRSTLPRTSSGKIRHSQAKIDFLDNAYTTRTIPYDR